MGVATGNSVRRLIVEHAEMAKCRNDAFPLVRWTLNGAAIVGAIPGSAGRKTHQLLAVGDPAVVLNSPTAVLHYPFLDLNIGGHFDLRGG
ncbi:MAG: hypothetical protein OXC10_17500 [Rhodospirillaceae bacterium]|nr:hypothetical protein [Rhodospirillaceae bacterium]